MSALKRRVLAGVADTNHKLAGIDGPLVRGFIPVAEGARVQCERHVLVSPGASRTFSKPFNSRSGRSTLRGRIGDIELRHFGAGHAARVGHVEADFNVEPEAAVAGT